MVFYVMEVIKMPTNTTMDLILKKEEFLVDKNGHPKAIVLKVSEYNKLLKFIEDLEDSLDLKHAIETSSGFISHNELLKQLKEQELI